MIQLRPYQQKAVDEIRSAFRDGKRAPLLVSPTGSGKTCIFSFVAMGATQRNKRVWILSHRAEIIRQICTSLDNFGVDHGIIAAGRGNAAFKMCQVASVQTLVNRVGKITPPDLMVIDEAHHGVSPTYRKIFDACPDALRLGVTATPSRLDGRGLGDVFDAMVMGPPVQDLIDQGFLSRPVYYAPPSKADTSKLHITAGDFNKHEVEELMDTPTITGDAVSHYTRICGGRPAIAFCASLKHCEHVVEQFISVGYRAAMIDGKMDDRTREDRIAALGDGRLHVLASCELIGEGVDAPIVAAAIMLRPTSSLALCLQQMGRVLRPYPGKACAFIIDHVSNLFRHGLAEESREWSLDAPARKLKKKSDNETVNRQCPKCYAVHAPAPKCPQCGNIYPIKSREISQVDGELVPLNAEELKLRRQRDARIEVNAAQDRESLEAIQHQRGYKPGWAKMILRQRMAKRLSTAAQVDQTPRMIP